MRKIISLLVAVLLLFLTGCSLLVDRNIVKLKDWSFQHNSETNDFSVFFALLNRNEQYIDGDVNVDIRIVNDADEEVYSSTASVTKDNFGRYTSKIAGEQYLAEIRIPENAISPGKSANGTVYLTVYRENNTVRFDEVNCAALYCLPVADLKLKTQKLPVQIKIKDYDGNVKSKIRIDDISYVCKSIVSPTLNITVSGTKTYGSSGISIDIIAYKIYDSKGYVAESGNLFISSIAKGDKFKDESISVYGVTPGETYKIVFSEYSY